MKCPIDVEKKVAEMRQELHPDALVEDAYRAILGAMNGAYCDGLQGKGYPEDLACPGFCSDGLHRALSRDRAD